jgi:aquaglyceroporin related protein, other eukaryote
MEKASESSDSSPPMTHAEHQQINPHHSILPDYRHTSVAGQPPYGEHGPLVDHKGPQEDVVQAEPDLWWSRWRHTLREPFSEFFGVFILIMFGDGVVAQVVLSNGEKGDYQSISWGWG